MGSVRDLLSLGLENKWDEVSNILDDPQTDTKRTIANYVMDCGDNIIHIAIAKCNIAQLTRLAKWFSPEMVNHDNENYLHAAVKRQDVDVVKIVYAEIQYTSLSFKNVAGETPLFMSGYLGPLESFDVLFGHFLDQMLPFTQVNYDEHRSNDVTRFSDHMLLRGDGDTLLHVSLRNGFIDIASKIMSSFPYLALMENAIGSTPLHEFATQYDAFKSGYPTCFFLKMFLRRFDNGLILSFLKKFVWKMQLWDEKVVEKHEVSITLVRKMIEYVKSKNPNPNPWSKNLTREPPIVVAVKNGMYEMVGELLKCYPTQIRARDKRKRSLIFIAVESRKPKMLNFLLKREYKKALLTEVIEGGNSLLHVAANFGTQPAWKTHGSSIQICHEALWFKRVRKSLRLSPKFERLENKDGKTADQIFNETHEKLLEGACKWFDTLSKSYSGVAGVVFAASIGAIATVPAGTSIGFLSILVVIAMFSALMSMTSFLSVTCARVDGRSYSESFRKIPVQHSFGLISLFFALVGLIFLFGFHEIIISSDSKIVRFGWITFLPIIFLKYLTCPLLCDLVRISWGDLQYYVHHREGLPTSNEGEQSLKERGSNDGSSSSNTLSRS